MTQSSQGKQPGQESQKKEGECKTLAKQVEDLTTSAAAGEFDKLAKDKLAEIAKGVDAMLQKYKDPHNGRAALVVRWEQQDERICNIRKHLEQCYPCWEDNLRKNVCDPVIAPLSEIRKSLREKLGSCQVELEDATFCFDQATAQLDAWKDICKWLKERLDKNNELIEEICKLDKCEDHAFALYIFYFELLRQHSRLMPGETEKEDRYDPVDRFCSDLELEPCCELEGFPYLIDPEKYEEKLGKAACRWREAGKKKAEAEAAVAWIDELRKRFAEDSKPESKRNKAKQYLKDLKPGKGDGKDDCGDGQQKPPSEPKPCPDPGQEPCPDPKPDPCPDPEPEPEPDPCPDPEPKPDPYRDPSQQQSS